MFSKQSVQMQGFLQATGLVLYIIAIAGFMTFISSKVFPQMDNEFWAPVIMLLLFVLSATITATIVLGRSGMLFWEKQYAKSFHLIAWTVGWGGFYFILILALLYLQNL